MTPSEARKRVEELAATIESAPAYNHDNRCVCIIMLKSGAAALRLLLAENERMVGALRAIRDEPLIEKGNRMDGTEVVMIVKSPRIHTIAEEAL